MREQFSIRRPLFLFFAGIPYAVFRVLYFFVTLPRRMRRRRAYAMLEKHIVYERLSEVPYSLHEMVEGVHKLRTRHGQDAWMRNPSMFRLIEALWEEEESSDWKIPTISEISAIRHDVRMNLKTAVPSTIACVVWAISEESHTFVGYDVETGSITNASPKNMTFVLRGKAPDSYEHYFAYAVSVRPVHEKSPDILEENSDQ